MSEYFERIDVEAIYGADHVFLEAIRLSLRAKDRAVLYMILCDAISLKNKTSPVSSNNIRETIEDILSDFDISLNEMSEKVEERMTHMASNICAKYRDNYSCNLLLDGVGRFKKLGVMAEGAYPFKELKAPGAVLGDYYYLNPYGYFDTNYEERFLNNLTFLEHLRSFSDACIYNV